MSVISSAHGKPFTHDELLELIDIINDGARRIKMHHMTPTARCMMYEKQITCLKMVSVMPDVIRRDMREAKQILAYEDAQRNDQ